MRNLVGIYSWAAYYITILVDIILCVPTAVNTFKYSLQAFQESRNSPIFIVGVNLFENLASLLVMTLCTVQCTFMASQYYDV